VTSPAPPAAGFFDGIRAFGLVRPTAAPVAWSQASPLAWPAA
jgi:hypothetical protein